MAPRSLSQHRRTPIVTLVLLASVVLALAAMPSAQAATPIYVRTAIARNLFPAGGMTPPTVYFGLSLAKNRNALQSALTPSVVRSAPEWPNAGPGIGLPAAIKRRGSATAS